MMTIPDKSRFNLVHLMKVVFGCTAGAKVGVFIDLENLRDILNFKFLKNKSLETQRIGCEVFYEGLKRAQAELGLSGVELFAYQPTGGSNLDLPKTVVNFEGKELRLIEDVLTQCDIVLYLSTYSATAPITAIAKKMGFRGVTMHGCNEIILNSGLAKNYEEVSAKAERFRKALTRCDKVSIEFAALDKTYRLDIQIGGQEAQKSHGLCREPGVIANLPAGEIYWVPIAAEGEFPMRFKDGTLALMQVAEGRIKNALFLRGNQAIVAQALSKFQNDPATGEIGELGFGTQELPFSGADIQDEKILGTLHVATGRSDHLGGSLTPEKFKKAENATHEDILFASHKTPEINVTNVWMYKDGKEELLIQNYQPTEFVRRVAL